MNFIIFGAKLTPKREREREKNMNSFVRFVMKTSALEAIGIAVVALFLFRFFSRLASLLLSGYSFKPKKANWAVITG